MQRRSAMHATLAGALALAGPVLAGSVLAGPVAAQEGQDEIIVTAQMRTSVYEAFLVPHVTMKRRADFVIVELEVSSDTRDASNRFDEMRQALRSLDARARGGPVTLALTDDEVGVVRPFTMGAAEELFRADRRVDTSVVTIRLRTPVGGADTLETINARMARFVEAAAKPGRVEMALGDAELTLIDPEQYREPMLADIAADGRRIAAMLGTGYGVGLSGLENQVAWRRTGDLELTLFLPYKLEALAH